MRRPEAKKEEKKPDEKKPDEVKAENKEGGPLPNKPGEPEFKLKIEPEGPVIFKSDKILSEAVHYEWIITNNTGKRQAYKVKCTSNEVFRVRPPLGFVDDKESIKVRLTSVVKEIAPANRHFFAIYHMASEDKSKLPRAVWTANVKPDGVKRLLCVFQKADGSEWKVGEKGPGGTIPQSLMQQPGGPEKAPPKGPPKEKPKEDKKKEEEKREEKKEEKMEKKEEEKKGAKEVDIEMKKEEKDKKKEEKMEEKDDKKEEKKEEKDEKKEDKKEEKKEEKKPVKK